ncbi:PRD domain-containing protein [Trueperella sp. LYQ143]|uniref:PRD domain-containing protein n=1 Tax=unclassified Trueperella TaxID=2630174 RepID=UPI0039836B12
MDERRLHVVRVFNNNVLLVRADDSERVVVGRGIGFGRREGDSISVDTVQQSYVELSSEQERFLDVIRSVDPRVLETVSAAVDFANDLLGDLQPSVYLLLADHLAFAAQRLGSGEVIRDTLCSEIKAVFPEEYAAGQLVLHFVNARLNLDLPESEAGFIALHLKAARTGDAVKQPLEQANELARIIDDIGVMLTESGTARSVDNILFTHIAQLIRQLRNGHMRTNDARLSIERDLPDDMSIARRIICRILNVPTLPMAAQGEAAFLAMFFHGWRQSTHESHVERTYGER